MASFQYFFLASMILIFFSLHLVDSHRNNLFESSPQLGNYKGVDQSTVVAAAAPTFNCGGACDVRCSKSSRPNLCKRACDSCCTKCSCVPPGTYGNYDSCPCYAHITTRGGVRKCP